MTHALIVINHTTSPAPAIDGYTYLRGIQCGPELTEEWIRGDEVVFRRCLKDRDGWVSETLSSHVVRGNPAK